LRAARLRSGATNVEQKVVAHTAPLVMGRGRKDGPELFLNIVKHRSNAIVKHNVDATSTAFLIDPQ